MNLKIALISTLVFSAITMAAPEKSYANYLPQSYLDSINDRRDVPVTEIREVPASIEIREVTSNSTQADFQSFILSQNPKLQKNVVNKIAVNVNKYSRENNVDPKLVLALMARESSFRSNVVSKSGAIGLGQLKRATAKDMGVYDPFNIVENIKATTRYLNWLMKRTNGDVDLTLASYNMGPGAVKRAVEAGVTLPEKVQGYVSDIKNFHSMI